MSTRVLAIAAIAAVLLAAGLYGARAGWFGGGGSDDDYPAVDRSRLGVVPPRTNVPNQTAIAFAEWGTPEAMPVVGVGAAISDSAPPHAVLTNADGRANVAIRVPHDKADGKPYMGYSVQVRVGDTRVWGTTLPRSLAKNGEAVIHLSLNLASFQSVAGADQPVTVVVDGTAMRKGDVIGIVRLELPKAS